MVLMSMRETRLTRSIRKNSREIDLKLPPGRKSPADN